MAGRSGGHNRKSLDELRAVGTWRPDRHVSRSNAVAVPGWPRPPVPLGPIAAAEWKRMTHLMAAAGTLSREMAAALYQYCQLFEDSERVRADRQERRARLATIEHSLPSLEGESLIKAIACLAALEQLNAKDVTQLRLLALSLRAYLIEFGFTPAARTRVQTVSRTVPGRELTPLERLQKQHRALREPPLTAV